MSEVIESDWKYFRSQIEPWRERYLATVNKKLQKIITDEKLSETDKFWNIKKTCDEKVKVLQLCFDDIRRSMMRIRLSAMLKYKIITNEDLQAFQDEHVREIENW